MDIAGVVVMAELQECLGCVITLNILIKSSYDSVYNIFYMEGKIVNK